VIPQRNTTAHTRQHRNGISEGVNRPNNRGSEATNWRREKNVSVLGLAFNTTPLLFSDAWEALWNAITAIAVIAVMPVAP
jgi:hypothetical protein